MGRDSPAAIFSRVGAVSIHAPAWGATGMVIMLCLMVMFQSTRPHGARHTPDLSLFNVIMFQSTRPHGARRGDLLQISGRCCFNPRARMGRDYSTTSGAMCLKSFQSTRPHGARQGLFDVCDGTLRFNPRARMGRDTGLIL